MVNSDRFGGKKIFFTEHNTFLKLTLSFFLYDLAHKRMLLEWINLCYKNFHYESGIRGQTA
jgi:hypothetical protein